MGRLGDSPEVRYPPEAPGLPLFLKPPWATRVGEPPLLQEVPATLLVPRGTVLGFAPPQLSRVEVMPGAAPGSALQSPVSEGSQPVLAEVTSLRGRDDS